MTNYQTLTHNAEQRRSIYQLNKHLPISQTEIVQMLEHTLLHTPSAFNSQSTRIVALFGEEHEQLWQLTANILRQLTTPEQFSHTDQKLKQFQAAAGSILFYEDQQIIQKLQNQFPTYADNFPIWSEHTNAMHQYAIWTALTSLNIGANLQHYNPLIDQQVQQKWQLPTSWRLRAQMVFGGIEKNAGEKTFEPIETRLKTFGSH